MTDMLMKKKMKNSIVFCSYKDHLWNQWSLQVSFPCNPCKVYFPAQFINDPKTSVVIFAAQNIIDRWLSKQCSSTRVNRARKSQYRAVIGAKMSICGEPRKFRAVILGFRDPWLHEQNFRHMPSFETSMTRDDEHVGLTPLREVEFMPNS